MVDEVALRLAEEREQARDKAAEELVGFGSAPIGSRGKRADESQEPAYSADDSDSGTPQSDDDAGSWRLLRLSEKVAIWALAGQRERRR